MTRACPLCSSPNPPEALFCLACGASLEGASESSADAGGAPLLADGFGTLPEGTLVRDETLVLVQVLGQGGFGITYLAREFSSGRSIAVKELFPFGCVRQNGTVVPSSLLDPDAWDAAREGFRREGALLTGHTHPNVVQVLDVWDERGTTFLAMEYLDGQTLAQVLEASGALGVRRVRAMIEQVGDALALLHQAGMLHRDIKPENIMLCRTDRLSSPSLSPRAALTTGATDRWVLLDFGAARAFAAGRTQALTQIVTPGYAPLEQYAARARGGPPSDIYALAATAYHALTGIAPPAATERAAHDDLRAPESLNPNIPRPLSEAIVRAMSLRIDGRPPSVEAWLRELDGAPASSSRSPFALPTPPASPRLPSVAPADHSDDHGGAAWDSRGGAGRPSRPVVPGAPSLLGASMMQPPLLGPASVEELSVGALGALGDRFGGSMDVFERDAFNSSRFASDGEAAAYAGVSYVPSLPEREPEGRIEEVAHGNVWYRVTITSRRIVWPKKCACCGGAMVLPLDVRTPAIWWQLPYCAACREHAERGDSMTVVGNSLSLLAFAVGATFLLLDGIEPGLWLWALAGLMKAASVAIPSWLLAARQGGASQRCCSYVPAGRFKKREGDSFVWEFRSRPFAEEFCALNGGDVSREAPPLPHAARSGLAERAERSERASRQRISN